MMLAAAMSMVLAFHAPLESAAPPPQSDQRDASNAIFVEAGGNGFVYSANVDHMLGENLSLRAGLGYVPDSTPGHAGVTTVPVLINALLGGGEHKLEVGAGLVLLNQSFLSSDEHGVFALPTAAIGYRYAPKHSGFMFRADITPIYIAPWAGVSAGYQF